MKKTILFILGLSGNIILGCYSPEHKDATESYTTHDTTKPAEPVNIPDTSGKVGFPK
jgi:hypothetical protein